MFSPGMFSPGPTIRRDLPLPRRRAMYKSASGARPSSNLLAAALPTRRTHEASERRMRTTAATAIRIATLLAALLHAAAAAAQPRDPRLADADNAFNAAVQLWPRSPSPMIDVLLRRALALQEQAGATPEALARIRDRIGRNDYNGGSYATAEPLFRDAVNLTRPRAGDADLDHAAYLGDLGAAIREQHRYAEAWPPVCRSLAIRRQALPANHPAIAASLDNMSRIAIGEGRLALARALLENAYRINSLAYGPDDPFVRQQAQTLSRLGQAAPGPTDPLDPCAAMPVS